MRLIVHTPGIDLSASRQVRLVRRVKSMLGHFATRARSVSVHVTDESLAHGKRLMHCQVTVALPRLRVVARHRASNVLAAVFCAVAKATRSLDRYLRKRSRERLTGVRFPASVKAAA